MLEQKRNKKLHKKNQNLQEKKNANKQKLRKQISKLNEIEILLGLS